MLASNYQYRSGRYKLAPVLAARRQAHIFGPLLEKQRITSYTDGKQPWRTVTAHCRNMRMQRGACRDVEDALPVRGRSVQLRGWDRLLVGRSSAIILHAIMSLSNNSGQVRLVLFLHEASSCIK
jgi:hypothetical protein